MNSIFTQKGVPPKVYQKVLTDKFGLDWQTWLPETLMSEIASTWGVSVIPEVSNKLGALKVFLTTSLFYSDAVIFEHIVHAMNDSLLDPDELSLSTPAEIMYAIYMLGPLKEHLFGREVIAYIRVCCEHAGLLKYPQGLTFAQPTYSTQALVTAVGQIKAARVAGDPSDMVVMQSHKLYDTNQEVVDKITNFNIELLGELIQ